MSIDGIWTGEVYGPFGWDNRGIFVLEDGRIIGGDNRQYSMGTYRIAGDTMTADLLVHYYGPPRTMFGESREEFRLQVEGRIEDHVINAVLRAAGRSQFDLQFRLTKRMDLKKA